MNKSLYSITSFQLKCIALISMFFDHFAIIWSPLLSHSTYLALRAIGRISFPIFAFLLAEGFFYTRSREKHLILLLLFAVISELPFDICLHHSLTDQLPGPMLWSYQNVFFTLSIGFLAMMYLSRVHAPLEQLAIIIISCTLAEVLATDYGSLGIVTILLFYYRRINLDLQEQKEWFCLPLLPLALTAYKHMVQLACLLALIPISLYKGEKGRSLKYFFYGFYPAHLLILYFIFESCRNNCLWP